MKGLFLLTESKLSQQNCKELYHDKIPPCLYVLTRTENWCVIYRHVKCCEALAAVEIYVWLIALQTHITWLNLANWGCELHQATQPQSANLFSLFVTPAGYFCHSWPNMLTNQRLTTVDQSWPRFASTSPFPLPAHYSGTLSQTQNTCKHCDC